MFNLRKLEERIVLDGAAMANAIDEMQEQEKHDLEMLQAQEAHNSGDWDYGLDVDESLYLDMPDFTDGTEGVHVLVISSDIEDADDLAAAAKDDVLVVRYDASDTDAEGLAQLIATALDGQKADSIAFAAHSGDSGQMNLTSDGAMSADSLDASADQQAFWKAVGDLLNEDGRIDLLGCATVDDAAGENLVSKIETLSGADVAASSDATGNATNWVLERGDIDAGAVYFDADKIGDFDGELADLPPVYNGSIPSPIYVDQFESFVYTVPANAFTDPEGELWGLWTEKFQMPKWMSFEYEGYTYFGTPTTYNDVNQEQAYPVTVTAYDGTLFQATSAQFNVIVNDVPEHPVAHDSVVPADITAIPQDDAGTWSFTLPVGVFSDPDNDPTTALTAQAGLSFKVSDDSPDWLGVRKEADGTLTLYHKKTADGSAYMTIPQEDVGTVAVTIVATDPTGRMTGLDIDLPVSESDEPPVRTTVALNVPEAVQGQRWDFTLPDGAFVDPEGELWGYWSEKFQMPKWMSYDWDNPSVGHFYGTPLTQAHVNNEQPYQVTVTAYDGTLFQATSDFFNVIVRDVDDAPKLEGVIPDATVTQHDVDAQITIPAATFVEYDPGDVEHYYAKFIGPEGTEVRLEDDPNYWLYLDTNTGVFTVNPEEQETVGTWTIEVWCYDNAGNESAATSFDLTVAEFDDPPERTDVPIVVPEATQGEPWEFTLPADAFVDPEGELWGYWSEKFQMPKWMSYDWDNPDSGRFYGTPKTEADVNGEQPYQVTVTAYDGTLFQATSDFFNVIVRDVPDEDPVFDDASLNDSVTYVERDPAVSVAGDNAFVTDTDSDNFAGGYLEVKVATPVADDKFWIQNKDGMEFFSGNVVVYNDEVIGAATTGDGTIKVALTEAADSAAVSELLQNITYQNTDTESPTENTRNVTFTLYDGSGAGGNPDQDGTVTATVALTVEGLNSDPEIVGAGFDNDYIDYKEGDGWILFDVNQDDRITDPDGASDLVGGSISVHIEGGFRWEDELRVGNGAPEIGNEQTSDYGSTLFIPQLNDSATVDKVSQWIQNIEYRNAAENPSGGLRKITITITDASGGVLEVDPWINVIGDNDNPVLTNISDGTANTFVEESSPVVIDAGNKALVSDIDSKNFDGGRVTVQITNFVPGEDVLSVRNQGALSGQIGFSGADGTAVKYGNIPFGVVTYHEDQGLLEITDLDEDATTTAVSALLQNITYSNSNTADPAGGTRTVQFQVWDGDGGFSTETNTTMTVNMRPVNDTPLIYNLEGAVGYDEGDPPVSLDWTSDSWITDYDSDNFSAGKLMIRFTSGYDPAEDRLIIRGDGWDGIDATPSGITYNGSVIGPSTTFPADSTGAWTITFNNAAATPEAVEALIHNIAYQNIDTDSPTVGARTVEFTLYDGHYTAAPDAGTSAAHTVTINVGGANDAPVITNMDAEVTYSEFDNAGYDSPFYGVLLDQDSNGLVTDVDSPNFAGGRLDVQIVSGLTATEDELSVRNEPGFGPASLDRIGTDDLGNVTYGFSQIGTSEYNANTGLLRITLTDDANPTSVSRLLQNIMYSNTNDEDPSGTDRSVRYTLWDGDGASAQYTYTTVHMNPINDKPVIWDIHGDAVTYSEGGAPKILDVAPPAAWVEDVDNDNFSGGYLKVQIIGGDYDEDMLTINSQGFGPGKLFADGTAVSYGDTLFGTWTNYDSANGVLTINFNKYADEASVGALVQNIAYYNIDTANPTEGVRTVRFWMSDGNAVNPTSDYRDVKLTVGDVNDPPSIENIHGDTLLFVEGDPAKLLDDQATKALVVDVDGPEQSYDGAVLTVDIVNDMATAEDVLGVSVAGNVGVFQGAGGKSYITYGGTQIGVMTFDQAVGEMTITFDADANTSSISEVIQNVTYQNIDSDSPTAGVRTVRFALSDGLNVSGNYDVNVTVQPVIDRPVIHDIQGDSMTYLEDSGAVILDQTPTVAWVQDDDSPDFEGGFLEVQITGGFQSLEDVLSIANKGNISYDNGLNVVAYNKVGIGLANFDSNTGILRIDNLTENATPAALSALVQSVTYENTDTGAPVEGVRTVQFSLNDGDGGTSDLVSMSVTVVGVNDQPFIHNIAGDTVTFFEGTDGVLLDMGTNAFVADADSAPQLDGGKLTLEIIGGDTNEDVLSIITDGTVGTAGSVVSVSGIQVGTLGTMSNGVLTIDLSANANVDNISTLVQHIGYFNTDTAMPTEGVRTVRFTLDDGKGATIEPSLSPAYDMWVTVKGVNDPPAIYGIGDNLTYAEEISGVITLDSDAYVADIDSLNFDGGRLTAFLSTSGVLDLSEDVLGIKQTGTWPEQVSINNNVVSYEGVAVGTFEYDKLTGALNVDFNDKADTEAVTGVMRHITYQNTDVDNPTTGERMIRFGVWDGDGGSAAYADMSVTVYPVNDPPAIANLHGDSVLFNEGDGTTNAQVFLDNGFNAQVTDVDSPDFSGGTLTAEVFNISGSASAEDILTIQGDPLAMGGVVGFDGTNITHGTHQIGTAAFANGKLTVSFTSTYATADVVSDVVRRITYYNTQPVNPFEGMRTVRFQLNDGDGTAWNGYGVPSSAFYDVNVLVNDVNDAPIIYNLNGDTVCYQEGAIATPLDSMPGGTAAYVQDLDSPNFDGGYLQVQISASDGYVPGEDILGIQQGTTTAGTISTFGNMVLYGSDQIGHIEYNVDGLLDIALHEAATTEAVTALIKSITYENADTLNPTAGERTVRFTLSDGDLNKSNVSAVTVNVLSINSAPTLEYIAGDVAYYTEQYVASDGSVQGGGMVLLDTGTSALVTDIDADPAKNFSGGKLWVEITTNFQTNEDVLTIWNEGNNGGQIAYNAATGAVSYEGDVIGTARFDEMYAQSKGRLSVEFTTADADAEAVSALIQHIGYLNTNADDPFGEGNDPLITQAQTDRTIQFALWDGDGTSADCAGAQAGYDSVGYQTMTLHVRQVNDAPELNDICGGYVTYSEGGPGTDLAMSDMAIVGGSSGKLLLDLGIDATVTDVDTTEFSGGHLKVWVDTNNYYAGEDVLTFLEHSADGVAGFTTPTYLTGNSTGLLTFTFDATATETTVNAILHRVAYQNALSTAMVHQGERTIRFELYDGDYYQYPDQGTASWDAAQSASTCFVTVNVTDINDPPVIGGLHDHSVLYVEGDSATTTPVFGALSLASGTVIGVSDVDSINFDGGHIWFEIVSNPIDSIGFVAGEDTLGISTGGDISYDGNLVRYQGSVIGEGTFNPGTGKLDIALTEYANSGNVDDLINNVNFYSTNTANPLEGWRTIRFYISDGDGGFSPTDMLWGAAANTAAGSYQMSVLVSGVNDAPAIANIAGDYVTFTETTDALSFSDTAIILDQLAGAVASDPDGENFPDTIPDQLNFSSGKLVVEFVTSDNWDSSEDWLGFTTGGGGNVNMSFMTEGSFYDESLAYGASDIADVDWEPSYGRLTIDFTGPDASYVGEDIVSEIIQSVMYSNRDSLAPIPGERTVRFQLTDGATSSANCSSPAYLMTVNVVGTNDAPEFAGWNTDGQKFSDHPDLAAAPYSSIYLESDGYSVVLQSGGWVSDVDIMNMDSSGNLVHYEFPNFDGGFLNVFFETAAGVAIYDPTEDLLDISTDATIGILNGGVVTYQGGTPFGLAVNGGDLLTITFNENATTTEVAALVKHITYTNTDSDDPQEGMRSIRFQFHDGDGGTINGETDYFWDTNASMYDWADVTVAVSAVNDAPVISSLASDVATFCPSSIGDPNNVSLFSDGVILDQDTPALLTDVDLSYDNYSEGALTPGVGGSLSVWVLNDAVSPEYSNQDVLSIMDADKVNGNTLGVGIEFDSTTSNVFYNGNQIGGALFVPSSGLLTVGFTGQAASTTEAVSALLQNITYINTNTTAAMLTNDRTVRFQLWDGGDGTDFTLAADSVEYSESVDMVLHVGSGNNAPVFAIDTYGTAAPDQVPGGWGIQYTEGDNAASGVWGYFTEAGNTSPAYLLGTDLAAATAYGDATKIWVYDADEPTSFAGGQLTIQLIGDAYDSDQDMIGFDSTFANLVGTQTKITYTGAGQVLYDGSAVGDVTWTPEYGLMTIDLLAAANTTSVSALMQSVTYHNMDSEDPTAGIRSLRFFIYDGGDAAQTSGVQCQGVEGTDAWNYGTIHVFADNDAPEVYNLDGETQYFKAQADTTVGVTLDMGQNARVVDVDSDWFSGFFIDYASPASVTQDSLTIRHEGMGDGEVGLVGTNVSYEGNVIGGMTVDTTNSTFHVEFSSNADAEAVSAVIQNVVFQTSQNPTPGERTFRFHLWDAGDGETAFGGNPPFGPWEPDMLSTAYSYMTVNVLDTNDPPVFNNLCGDAVTFTEGDGAATLHWKAVDLGTNAYVTDVDTQAAALGVNTPYPARLTVELLGGDSTEDVLEFDWDGAAPSGYTYADFRVEDALTGNIGGTISDGTSNIGSYTWNQAAGILTVDMSTYAEVYQLSAILKDIVYYNEDTVNPTAGERTLRFNVWDREGTDSYSPLGLSSGYCETKVTVVPTNDGPVISNISLDSVTYYEESGPVSLDQTGMVGATTYVAASVSDIDSPDFDGGRLKAQITGVLVNTEDVLGIRNVGFTSIAYDGLNVTYMGSRIGTATYSANTGLLDVEFNENATPDAVSALVQNITYDNTNTGNPTEGFRTVRFTLWDGDGMTGGGVEASVNVVAVNDAPAIHNIESDVMIFQEQDNGTNGALVMDQGVAAFVTDPDYTGASFNFSGGTLMVTIADGAVPTEDWLDVATGTAGSTGVYNLLGTSYVYSGANAIGEMIYVNVASNSALMVDFTSPSATQDAVSMLVQNIRYANTNPDNPTAGDRTIQFGILSDGGNHGFGGDMQSPLYNMTVRVEGVNDAPVISDLGTEVIGFTEDTDVAVFLDNGTAASVADVDSANFDGGHLTVQILDAANGGGVLAIDEDVLWVSESGNITFDGNKIFYGGDQIGVGTYTDYLGKLDIELTENADTEAISALLQSVVYQNTDTDDPTGGYRTVRFALSDGDGAVADVKDVTVTVWAHNDKPEIHQIDGDELTYPEGGAAFTFGTADAMLIDQDGRAFITDPDTANFTQGAMLDVQIVGGFDAPEDRLCIFSDGFDSHWDHIHYDQASGKVFYGTNAFGTVTFPSQSQMQVTVDANQSVDADVISRLVQNIAYYNVDINMDPSGADRHVAIRFFDNDPQGAFDINNGEWSESSEAIIHVVPVNTPPVIHNLHGDILGYKEGDGAQVIEQSVDAWVDDDDSHDLEGGHLYVQITNPDSLEDKLNVATVGNINVIGNEIFFNGSGIGTFTYTANTGLLDVTLTKHAYEENVDDLIRAITYENTNTADPEVRAREVKFTLDDGDGGNSLSAAVYATVNIQALNDAPVIMNVDSDVVTFTEDGAPVFIDLGENGYVKDVDSTDFAGGSLTADIGGALVATEDLLSIYNEGTGAGQISYVEDSCAVFYEGEQIGIANYATGTGVLNINFAGFSPDTEAVAALIQSITYENTNHESPNTAPRPIEVWVNDGDGSNSDHVWATVQVVPVNDAPVIHELDGDRITFVEDQAPTVLDQQGFAFDPAYITDPDIAGHLDGFSGGHLYVQVTGGYDNSEDKLQIQNLNDIVYNGNSSEVTYKGNHIGVASWNNHAGLLDIEIDGDVADDTAAVTALIQSIAYNNIDTIGPTPGERTVRFQMWDGGDALNSGKGASSNYAYVNVTVVDFNDQPVIHNISGDSVTFTEGDDPIVIDVDENGRVEDLDSPNFDGGRLEVEITGGMQVDEDQLWVRTLGDLAVDENGFVNYAGKVVGTISYDPGTGILGVDLNEQADTAIVSALIQNVTYDNRRVDDPTAGTRTIRYRLYDGDDAVSGGVCATVGVVAVNDAPEIHQIDADTKLYMEGDGTIRLDQKVPSGWAFVTDADSTDFNGGRLEVQIASGANPTDTAEDVLGIRSVGIGLDQISLTGNNIKYENVLIGTVVPYDVNTNKLVINFNADADEEAVTALVQQITYTNTDSDSPYEGDRVVSFMMYDGDGAGGTSETYTMTVTVQGVNDAPVLTNLCNDVAPVFTEGDGKAVHAKLLDAGENAAVTDADGADAFKNGKITVQMVGDALDQDWLTLRNEGNGLHQVGFDIANNVYFEGETIGTAKFVQDTGLLTITFNDSDKVDDVSVSSVLQNIMYNNTNSDMPTVGQRTMQFMVYDGEGATSAACTTTIQVEGVNDAPIIYNVHGDCQTYVEGSDPLIVDLGTDADVEDVDTTDFGGGQMDVWVVGGDATDQLDIDTSGVITTQGVGIDTGVFVLYNGTNIGTADRNGELIGTAGNRIDVTFNAGTTNEQIAALMQSITFTNTGDSPLEGDRTIRFTVTDGDFQWDGDNAKDDATSAAVDATVTVVQLNDAPIINNLAGDSVSYNKNQGMVLLDQGVAATVTDPEGAAEFAGGYLSVEIVGGGDKNEDLLGISNVGGISVVGNDVYYQGARFGTYTVAANGDELMVNFLNDKATDPAVENLIQSIAYENTNSVSPQSGERVIRFTMYDGDGPDGTSVAYDTYVNVNPNRAPEVQDGIADWDDMIMNAVNRYTIPDAAFDDPDGPTDDDNLTYTAALVDVDGNVVGAIPGWLTLSENGTFIGKPLNLDDFVDGKISVQVTATDPGGLFTTTTFDILAPSDVNHSPDFDDPNPGFMISEHEPITGQPLDGQSVTDPALVGSTWTYTKLADSTERVKITASDPDADNLTYRIVGGTGAGNFAINATTGEIRLTSDGAHTPETTDDLNYETGPKAFTLEIVAEDEHGSVTADPATMVIFVSDENDAPVAETIPIQTAKPSVMGDYYEYYVENPNELWGQVVAFTDEDGDTLKYRAEIDAPDGMSDWLKFDATYNQFTGPFPTTEGLSAVSAGTYTYTITLYADDGEVEVGNTFQLDLIIGSNGLRDAVRYLEIYDGDELPADAEEAMELNELVMYAEAEDVPAEDAELYDVLALLEQQGFEPEDARA